MAPALKFDTNKLLRTKPTYKQKNYSFIVRFLDIWTNLHKIGGYLTLHWDGLVLLSFGICYTLVFKRTKENIAKKINLVT